MPIKKAAFKALKQTKKRTAFNNKVRSNLDYLKRKFSKALAGKNKQASQELYAKLSKALDKASQKKIIKKNTASRMKSRLAKKVNALN